LAEEDQRDHKRLGGSVTSAYLGLKWKSLNFGSSGIADNFVDAIVGPMRHFCSRRIDVPSVIVGLISPFHHPSDIVAWRYNNLLYRGATLQDLPSDDEGPRFTIYATSLQTGASVRFSRPYLAEYHLGMVDAPKTPLAFAVAASTAFPPVLCPATLKQKPDAWRKTTGADLYGNTRLRARMRLGDGGIYDNMGLERLWDRYSVVLVSDAGAPFTNVNDSRKVDFSQIMRLVRCMDIVGNQTRALRKRRLIADFKKGVRTGTYWGIATHIADYGLEKQGLPGPLVADSETTADIARMRTRLSKFSDAEQERLINWGYALTDTAMRRHVVPKVTARGSLPYPDRPM
jgi:NTE family protein